MSSFVPDNVPPSSEETVYEEEDDGTDNEEEVLHDLVECDKCGTSTHYSVGECGKCGEKFKMSKAGYILTGEDGAFICDDYNEDDDEVESSVMEEGEYASDMETDTNDETSDGDDDDDAMLCDDEIEYVKEVEIDPNIPRRMTRSSIKNNN